MDVTYECKEPRLRVNFRHTIIARNERGEICGTYIGYWIPSLCSVTLYPYRAHPAWKPGFPDRQVKIYDGLIKCNRGGGLKVGAARSVCGASEEEKGETWRDRKKPMKDQIGIKF